LADPFNINVSNGESGLVFVTIKDLNTRAGDVVFDQTMESGRQVPVYIQGESGTNGHIVWQAQSSDRQRCGGDELTNLSSGYVLTVTTPLSC
jgi:hypothetical protein